MNEFQIQIPEKCMVGGGFESSRHKERPGMDQWGWGDTIPNLSFVLVSER